MESCMREKKNFKFNAKFDGKPMKLLKRCVVYYALHLLSDSSERATNSLNESNLLAPIENIIGEHINATILCFVTF